MYVTNGYSLCYNNFIGIQSVKFGKSIHHFQAHDQSYFTLMLVLLDATTESESFAV